MDEEGEKGNGGKREWNIRNRKGKRDMVRERENAYICTERERVRV